MKWLSPRWRKVLRDLWSNKTRTILVLLSIAVGVSAIGMVMGSQIIVDRNLPAAYAAVNPSAGTMFTITTFDEDQVEAVRAMDEVAEAEGRRSVNVRFLSRNGEWHALQLIAVPNFKKMTLNQIHPETGAFPPPLHELLLERASVAPSLGLGGVTVGDTLTVEAPSGKKRALRVAGTVHDMSQAPAFMTGAGYGYITFDTLAWLGEPRDFNQLDFTVADSPLDFDHVTAVGKRIEQRLESAGQIVLFTFIPPPGEHPAQNFLDAFSLILGGIGALSLLLSGFLIVNTLSAILTQHVRQIGIMKAIGARAGQIATLYFVMVLLFGVLALLIAVPLGALGAIGLANIFAGLLNFDVGGVRIDPQVLLVQVVIGLAAPMLAALLPILRGVRVTVREAVSEHGLGKGHFGHSLIDRAIVGLRFIFPMGRPMQISLRNTFRRKSRLALTLITLSLASTIFIAIFSIRASLQQTLDDALSYFDYDVQVIFDRSYRTDRIRAQLETLPGIDRTETWGFGSARRLRPDGTESDSIIIYAPLPDSQMINPTVLEGRWIVPGDTNAVVINTDVLKTEEDIKVGDEITLKLDDKDTTWIVVGIVRGVLTGSNAFVNFDYYSRVTNAVGRAQISLVRLRDRSPENQTRVGQTIEDSYRNAGFRVQTMQTIGQLRATISTIFDVIILFLLAMAVLLGVVGGLGLMGTMSINVLERTREIGVMRAIGASNGSILRIVLVEGLIIGLLSWTIGGLIALPASRLLTITVGMALLQAAPTYIFSTNGAILWLAIVLALAFLASFLPARHASLLTVREVLSYE
ncbi:MAG: ABC transporter permease [Chloroflexi bacterium]|nr:MAG: ABC transporter permease [Chloroflexota bacterium]